MIAARITEPPVGASTWASGSHVCTGHIGTLTANASRKAMKISFWAPRPSGVSIQPNRSKLPVTRYR